MLKNTNISLIMDTLYGEIDSFEELSKEDSLELKNLETQLDFLDEWTANEGFSKKIISKNEEKEILNIKELATYLKLTESEVVFLLDEIPHIHLSNQYRFQ